MAVSDTGTMVDGDAPSVGVATSHFFGLPGCLPWWQFLGVAFIIVVVTRGWARHVNKLV